MATRFTLGALVGAVMALGANAAVPLSAQMHMNTGSAMAGTLGIPETRAGSGTSWVPDASPMHAIHLMLGNQWTVMLHGVGFLEYDAQGGPRGSTQVGSINWLMVAATHSIGEGQLQLRSMFSAEPWTIGARGYPLLVQSGESYGGVPLHDRQHPHDLFMELAASFEQPLNRAVGVSLYLAPVGEPALGPVAFPHRPSAADDPLAPISHHWQDGTHVTFGVLTAGLFTHGVRLEASWFNGREPDENRTDFDYAGRRLDSYSGRVTVNPGPRWSLSAWYGYLKSPEGLFPGTSLHRFGAAVLTSRPLGPAGSWSSSLIYGANEPLGSGRLAGSILLESTANLDGTNSVFGRIEYVQKSAEDLAISSVPPTAEYGVGAVALGYLRRIGRIAGLGAGIGFRGSVNILPAGLSDVYGSRTPLGCAVYLQLRPGRATMAGSTRPE